MLFVYDLCTPTIQIKVKITKFHASHIMNLLPHTQPSFVAPALPYRSSLTSHWRHVPSLSASPQPNLKAGPHALNVLPERAVCDDMPAFAAAEAGHPAIAALLVLLATTSNLHLRGDVLRIKTVRLQLGWRKRDIRVKPQASDDMQTQTTSKK